MSIRPIKQITQSQPTIEGAGVRLRRAFGFGKTSDLIRSCCLTTFEMKIQKTILPGFRGTRIEASKPLPTSSRET